MAKFDQMFHTAGVKKAEPHPRRETKWIHYTKLVDNPAQYCDEKSKSEIEALADLIEADKEVLQNLLVRKIDTDEFEIIAGHKRRRACKLLVEERGKKQYEFLPCIVKNISDVQAEFQVYSSNGFHEKNDYEKLHELERMKYLLETYPEEFPHLQTGRMVERLAKQKGMKRTTVGEYLTISKNLGPEGREEFRKGNLKKSAAVELASLPEEEQEDLLEKGMVSHREIKRYKEEKQAVQQEPAGTAENGTVQSESPHPEEPLAGQYKVVSTDMEIAEEAVPESGTENLEEHVPESSTEELSENEAISGTADLGESGTENVTLERMILEFGENRPTELREIIKICEEKEKNVDRAKAVQEYEAPYGNHGGTAGEIFYDFWGYSKGVRFRFETKEHRLSYIQFVNVLEDLYGPWNPAKETSETAECTESQEEEQDKSKQQIADTQYEETPAEEYTPKYFLEEQKEKLNDIISSKETGAVVPKKLLERQKTLVCALANMVCELERMEVEEKLKQETQPELPELKNMEQRKEWLRNYKDWGVWYQDKNIGAVYYKYDFEDGTRLIAETYQKGYTTPFLHLVGGPPERPLNQYGVPKYPYHEQYSRHPDCETELLEFLKAVQKK